MNNNKTLHPITHDKFLNTFRLLLNNNGIKKLITITNFVVNKDIIDNKGQIISMFVECYQCYQNQMLNVIQRLYFQRRFNRRSLGMECKSEAK